MKSWRACWLDLCVTEARPEEGRRTPRQLGQEVGPEPTPRAANPQCGTLVWLRTFAPTGSLDGLGCGHTGLASLQPSGPGAACVYSCRCWSGFLVWVQGRSEETAPPWLPSPVHGESRVGPGELSSSPGRHTHSFPRAQQELGLRQAGVL